jgi:hypothetical protein
LLGLDGLDQLAFTHAGGASDAEAGRNGLQLGENHARET